MENETRVERWLERAIERAVTPRGGAEVIAALTTVATIAFGLLMTVIDHKNFTSVWLGLWWAVQTVTTVGYGDHVPTNPAGMLVAALVMLLGLAFLSVVTAAITSSFVARATESRTARAGGGAAASVPEPAANDIAERLERLEALLRQDDVVERLDRMEALLRDRP
jgi:voltage-gated potassium channel